MKIPLKYNLRSLWVRKVGTLMTALGIALTVAVFIIMQAMVNGINSLFVETGQELNLVVIREGTLNEVNSSINRDAFQTVRNLPGVALDADGQPLLSGELVVVISHPRLTGESANVIMRGMTEKGIRLRPEARLVEGRWFRKGVREIVASRSLSRRFRDLRLGDTLQVAGQQWKVVGIFDTGGSAYDSEIWGDYDEIAQVWNRPIYSSLLVQSADPSSLQELKNRIGEDRRIHLRAEEQKAFFSSQVVSSMGIRILGVFISTIMGVGACFAAMNMMYGMVMARLPEVATLRALGFRRRSILASFFVESILLALLGGVLGCLLSLPLHGYSAGTSNFATFSEIVFHFRISPEILLQGLLYSVVVGILGGLLPARRAAGVRLIEALRG